MARYRSGSASPRRWGRRRRSSIQTEIIDPFPALRAWERSSASNALAPFLAGVREFPIELARFVTNRPRLIMALLDPRRRKDLAVIAGREHLVGLENFAESDGALMHLQSDGAQKLDDTLARDAVEKSAVRNRRMHHAFLDYEQIGSGEFGNVPERIEHDCVVEPLLLGFSLGASRIGV